MSNKKIIDIYIGYDSKENVAFHVLCSSIIRRSSLPVRITPICLTTMHGIYDRKRNELQSTEFSFSRFLTPYLSGYSGWSIFMDCDMVMLDDVSKLWELRDDRYAIMCVKHNHTPKEAIKFLNQKQTAYERKNWSSLMLMNNQRCTALTPEYVNNASGLELHRFKWLRDEDIGSIPKSWNYLVDYDQDLDLKQISNLHFTEGGPYFEKYRNCSFADSWFNELSESKYPLGSL